MTPGAPEGPPVGPTRSLFSFLSPPHRSLSSYLLPRRALLARGRRGGGLPRRPSSPALLVWPLPGATPDLSGPRRRRPSPVQLPGGGAPGGLGGVVADAESSAGKSLERCGATARGARFAVWSDGARRRQDAAASAARCAARSEASVSDAALRTSSVLTARSRRSVARRSAGGLACAAATGESASTPRKAPSEEMTASRSLERNGRERSAAPAPGVACAESAVRRPVTWDWRAWSARSSEVRSGAARRWVEEHLLASARDRRRHAAVVPRGHVQPGGSPIRIPGVELKGKKKERDRGRRRSQG